MRARWVPFGFSLALVLALGCRPSGTTEGEANLADAGAVTTAPRPASSSGARGAARAVSPSVLLGERSYRRRPATPGDAGETQRPALLLALHGYGSNGTQLEAGLGLDALADAHHYALAIPDGTPDSAGRRFWNAGDSCCNFDDKKVDDVAYLGAVIDDATQRLGTDPARVYIVGHSNGGFMALRLACDLGATGREVTAVISLAGAGYVDTSRCQPSRAVSVLQVHGDADTTIPIAGGTSARLPEGAAFASAKDTVGAWGTYDHCTGALAAAGRVDLTPDVPGTETVKTRIGGCPAGIDVELWTVKGGEHSMQLTRAGSDALGTFLDSAGKTDAAHQQQGIELP